MGLWREESTGSVPSLEDRVNEDFMPREGSQIGKNWRGSGNELAECEARAVGLSQIRKISERLAMRLRASPIGSRGHAAFQM